MRTFTFSDGKSNKFWNIDLQGKGFTVRFGKIGAAGQTQVKEFPDEAQALVAHDKLVAEKVKKGYVETSSPAPVAPPPAPVAAPPAALAAPPASRPASPPPPSLVPAAASGVPLRTFEFTDDSSNKFWNIQRSEAGFTITYGRLGSDGQTQVKSFPNEEKAQKEYDKLIAEKVRKGYRETTPVAAPTPTSLRESLEQALVENPDELVEHMAYADHLTELGDPLGELIRVQLALEDPTRSVAQRRKLQKQEQVLLETHQRAWLGELAPFLLDPPKEPTYRDLVAQFTLARGWLNSLEVHNYNVQFMRTLARSPCIRLLRRLVLIDNAYETEEDYPPGDDLPAGIWTPQLFPLARCPYLTSVRYLVIGEMMSPQEEAAVLIHGYNAHTDGQGAVGLVKLMPRLEELHLLAHQVDADQLFTLRTLGNLRILRLYHNNSYPLAKLAKNPSLGKLTHLLCHPHAMDDEVPYIRLPAVRALVRSPNLPALTHLRLRLSDMGDAGVREIIDSGILARLKVLDLRHGCVTDEGARLLAACPDFRKLEALDLAHNALTAKGIAALEATGVKLEVSEQWGDGNTADDEQQYLYAGDIE